MASLTKLMAALTCAAVLGLAVTPVSAAPVKHSTKTAQADKKNKTAKTTPTRKEAKAAPRKAKTAAKVAAAAKPGGKVQKAARAIAHRQSARSKSTKVVATASAPKIQRKQVVARATVTPPKSMRHAETAPKMAQGVPALGSGALLVMDQESGASLLEKNANQARPIASITKLMTAMVMLDAHQNMNEVLTITAEDVDRIKHSSSRLSVGTQLTRKELLRLALMSSENRAAHALGRSYPGGVTAFVAAMNRKARTLGMGSARFVDPTGLSASNMATPKDLATMVAAASAYPDIQAYSTSEEATVPVAHSTQVFRNTNPLVRQSMWEIAVSKTGYIQEAGRCLVMKAFIKSRPTLIVLLDGPGKNTRVQDAVTIKRWIESQPALLAGRTQPVRLG